MQRDRRVTVPVLMVLLLLLGGAAYLVWNAHEDAVSADDGARVAAVDDEEPRRGDDPMAPGAWRHHDWAQPADPGATGRWESGAATMGAGAQPDEYDPQAWAMRRSFPVDGDAGVGPLPFTPVERVAQIVESEGSVRPGSSCQVRVLPVRTSEFNCLVRVVCEGRILYPNPTQTAGYAPCEVENGMAVSAVDDGPTAADGDPLVRIDLREGVVTVEDRGDGVAPFRATLRVQPTS
jgi:hypothetical protein